MGARTESNPASVRVRVMVRVRWVRVRVRVKRTESNPVRSPSRVSVVLSRKLLAL